MEVDDGRRRVVIEGVAPEIDAGRFPIKRTVGERVVVESDVFADGHDVVACVLRYRHDAPDGAAARWTELPMSPLGNDRWRAEFSVAELGRYRYTIEGWVDHFATWRRDLAKRVESDQDVPLALLVGVDLIRQAAARARGAAAQRLERWADDLASDLPIADRVTLAFDDALVRLAALYPDRRHATSYDRELGVVVDRERARFGAWYELFPRSTAAKPGSKGTFATCADRLEYVAEMGFDVVYLPPIHPIGRTFRKGRNNSTTPTANDPGSPWAIGGPEGGHTAINPDLGTVEEFGRLVDRAKSLGMEIALDVAFQCSPDHPAVKEHPDWFRWRPDGTVQYAENPPKKYQDIYPFEFEGEGWRSLWDGLRDVFTFWIEQGVKIFRVDNPHTKPFPFWEWLMDDITGRHPDVIFLAEAFTRPKIMYRLAKLGFTQSYNYFPWRNTKQELTEYLTELTTTSVREFFRPNLWPNTPDILTEYLQHGGRPAFITRLVLAATLGASYGIYGPAYELCESTPREPGSEEYFNSEKYEIRHWDLDDPHSLSALIGRVNRIRKDNAALHSDWSLRFHTIGNDQLIAYSKRSEDGENVVVVIVNLDPRHAQSGMLELPLDEFGIDRGRPYQVHDLLTDATYLWQGDQNFVELDPHVLPAHILLLERRLRTEEQFEYYGG